MGFYNKVNKFRFTYAQLQYLFIAVVYVLVRIAFKAA